MRSISALTLQTLVREAWSPNGYDVVSDPHHCEGGYGFSQIESDIPDESVKALRILDEKFMEQHQDNLATILSNIEGRILLFRYLRLKRRALRFWLVADTHFESFEVQMLLAAVNADDGQGGASKVVLEWLSREVPELEESVYLGISSAWLSDCILMDLKGVWFEDQDLKQPVCRIEDGKVWMTDGLDDAESVQLGWGWQTHGHTGPILNLDPEVWKGDLCRSTSDELKSSGFNKICWSITDTITKKVYECTWVRRKVDQRKVDFAHFSDSSDYENSRKESTGSRSPVRARSGSRGPARARSGSPGTGRRSQSRDSRRRSESRERETSCGPVKIVTMKPLDIRFSQDSISSMFRDGSPIQRMFDNFAKNHRRAAAKVAEVPKLRVKYVHRAHDLPMGCEPGWYATSGNRRLWVFQQLQMKHMISDIKVEVSTRPLQPGQMTTCNSGTSVTVREKWSKWRPVGSQPSSGRTSPFLGETSVDTGVVDAAGATELRVPIVPFN